jgi:DGQHR domain-containing protein
MDVGMPSTESIQKISVIVPESPFVGPPLQGVRHCLAALDVQKLMDWWPGQPHTPHRDANKVRSIQRSLDWKRVAQIAAYLLQEEIVDARAWLDDCFRTIYEPKALEPGREWPPRVPRVVGYEPSEYPIFSNVLVHVNGATVQALPNQPKGAANLVFDETHQALYFTVIDGQHRINGAYLALHILNARKPGTRWEIPTEVFLDLDKRGEPPRRQAQIFIDVNFYQKKVDRSLVADLFPTARGRGPLDDKERAQDIGRRLMLDVGPLKGMIQIPGIKFGVKDIITLATLNSAIEDSLRYLSAADITSLDGQTEFFERCLEAWLDASGRREEVTESRKLDPNNVAYQGRVLVSFIALVPACLWLLNRKKVKPLSERGQEVITDWLRGVMQRAGLLHTGKFVAKHDLKLKGFLGSGGIGRLRDTLWAAAIGEADVRRWGEDRIKTQADAHRATIYQDLMASS